MRKLTILLSFIALGNILGAQGLINIRLIAVPQYDDQSDYSQLHTLLQGSYNVSPEKGTLGLELGIELQYAQSKTRTYSCDCLPIFQSGSIIHRGEVSSFSSKSYHKSMTAGLFSSLVWNANKTRKFRFKPMLQVHIYDEIFSTSFEDRFWNYKDGSTYDQPTRKTVGNSEGLQLEFYVAPIIQVDYLIIPKWNLRLGVHARLIVQEPDFLRDNTLIIGGMLTKNISG